MALTGNLLPFGMRRVFLTPYTSGEVLGLSVRLPASRTLGWKETTDSEELEGDDVLVAVHDGAAKVEWELEQGGISLEALKVIANGTIAETGLTPNQVKTYTKKSSENRPYFKIEGQAINDSGGDVHPVILRAKATEDIEGEFAQGSFFMLGASGIGVAMANDDLYKMVQNETAVTPS